MEISSDILTWGVSGAVSAGIAFGVIKTQLHNTVTYEKHREICQREREVTSKAIQELHDRTTEVLGMVKEIHGYLKAKNGGQL